MAHCKVRAGKGVQEATPSVRLPRAQCFSAEGTGGIPPDRPRHGEGTTSVLCPVPRGVRLGQRVTESRAVNGTPQSGRRYGQKDS